MASAVVRSYRGIAFTQPSVAAVEKYRDGATENKCVLVLGGVFDKNGQPHFSFGVDRETNLSAIPDQLEGILFYWSADQPTLDRLRGDWCVDAEYGRNTRVVPLPKDDG